MCRARWAEGRATITTDASSTIMSWATAMTARDQYRLGSGASDCGAIVGTIWVVVTWVPLYGLDWRAGAKIRSSWAPWSWPSGTGGSTIGAKVPFPWVLYGTCVPFVNPMLGPNV